MSINELTEVMLRVAGSTLRPVYGPVDETAGSHRAGANDLAAGRLDWRPRIALEDGLAWVHAWMAERTGDDGR